MEWTSIAALIAALAFAIIVLFLYLDLNWFQQNHEEKKLKANGGRS